MAGKQKSLREPSGLCRWRRHDLCTLNSVARLNGELLQHVVDLECAINRESSIIRNVHVYHLDQVIKELWLLRGRMASRANRNGSPVNDKASMMFPSVMALLDEAVKVRKGYASE
jgi:FAD/FMN-containing dehydrogenase